MIREYRRAAFTEPNPWPIRLRLLLIIPGSWRWNKWVRDITARLQGHASYDSEMTE